MEAILSKEYRHEVDEVLKFLNGLTPEEKREFSIFIKGVNFAKGFSVPGCLSDPQTNKSA